MKYFNKFLLLLFSVLVLSGVSINTYNYVYADDEDVIETTEESDIETEKVSQTIKFVDEEGNPLYIEDTISISTFNQEQPYVFDEDGNPEYAYKVENGGVTFSNLTQGETYYISFDGDTDIEDHFYIFKDEQEDGIYKYHQWASFTAYEGYEYEISFSQLQFLDEYKQELIDLDKTEDEIDEIFTNIFNTNEVMELVTDRTYFYSGCSSGKTKTSVTVTYTINGTGYKCTISSGSNVCSVGGYPESTRQGSYAWSSSAGKSGYVNVGSSVSAVTDGSKDYCVVYNTVCTGGNYYDCNNGASATQYYDGNGGSCTKGSDTRTRASTSRKCASDGNSWATSCSYGSWLGSVSAPSCSRGNGTDTRTISFNKNVALDSASQNVTGTDSKKISRTIYYSHNGWSGYSDTFTSNQTAYAQWSTSYGSWSTITLPTATRTGYTFKDWEYGGTTYSAGTTVDPREDRTYAAQWQANNYTYTIKYVSSTGKDLGSTTITKAFDGVNII